MNSAPTAWMPLYVGDYLRDTQHLSTAEHGAYCLLLFRAWTSEGLLSPDPERLRRITGMTPKEWKTAWAVLREFFTETESGFRHKRVEAELARAGDLTEKRRAAANARWKKEGVSNANASANDDANALQTALPPQPQPQSQKDEEDGDNIPLPHRALAFSGRVIRLNKSDFETWRKAYHAIPDLTAELVALDDWLRDLDEPKTVKRWFNVVSGALAKKHQAALAADRGSDRYQMPIA